MAHVLVDQSAPSDSDGRALAPTRTFADGGSAASQASDLDERAWTPRRGVAAAIRVAVFLIPLIAGFLAVRLAMVAVPRPAGTPAFVAWMIGLMVVSFGAAYGAQRALRFAAPLRTLFTMSLVFPDHAPSRFSVALRSGTARRLAERIRQGDEPGSHQAAAEELLALMTRLGRHDRLTRGHSERVRAYSVMLGEELDLDRDDLDRLNWAALIHDIGKLEVPEEILNKRGRPDEAEWQQLRAHPAAAADYVETLRPWLGDWVSAATQHHERWDGRGYPAGLEREQIHLAGRIVAVADAYDVMTAPRSYKASQPAAQAHAELLNNAGSQFDPTLVRAFLQISLGRLQWATGFGWLAHLPDLLRGPISTISTTGSGLAAAGALTVAGVAGAAAEPTVNEPDPAVSAPLEGPFVPDLDGFDLASDDAPPTDPPPADTPGAAPTPDPAGSDATTTTTRPVDRSDVPEIPVIAPVVVGAGTTSTTTTTAPESPPTSEPTSAGAGTPASTTTTATTTTPATTAPVTATTTDPGASSPDLTLPTLPVTLPTLPPLLPTTTTTTTTTSTTTTTTPTTTTTTTTTVPPAAFSWYPGAPPSGDSTRFLPLDGSLASGPLPNYDPSRDDDPGLLVQKGTGVGETDADQTQWWRQTLVAPTRLDGTPQVDLYVAVKDFDTSESAVVEVGIYRCDVLMLACSLQSVGSAAFDQSDFGTGFGHLRVTLSPMNANYGLGSHLVLEVAPAPESDDDIWLAFATTTFPMRLQIL